MTHPNEDLARKGFEAFSTGDLDTLREQFDPGIVWHVGGRSPFAGDYKGIDEVLGFFAKTMEKSEGTFKIALHDVLANDEHVVALVNVTGQREGATLNDNAVQVLHVSDGKVTESWFHPGDQYAGDEFFS